MFFALILIVYATELDHLYEKNEELVVWYNRGILPNAPNMLIGFQEIPWCQGQKNREYPTSPATLLSGIVPKDSGIDLRFRQDSIHEVFCTKKLSSDEYSALVKIIQLGILAELSIDQLPVWTAIGKDEEDFIYAYTTFHITIHYNKDRVIFAKVLPDNPVLLFSSNMKNKKSFELKLSYSVSWIPSEVVFDNRMQVFSQSGMFPTRIHWISIMNSSAIILAVCFGIMALLYKTLRKDLGTVEDGIFDLPVGWKNVEGEAMSPPVLNALLSGLAGIGSEVFLIVFVEILLLELEMHEREVVMPAVIAVSGVVGGYVTGSTQKEFKGWIFAAVLAGGCFPFSAILGILSFLLFGVSVHLLYIIGLILNALFYFMITHKMQMPRAQKLRIKGMVIKKKPWYLENYFLVAVGGILPFISIAMELSFLLRSFLAYQFYIMHGFLIISFYQVVVCLGCVGIATSYLVLNTEDPKWHWPVFFSGSILGVYILLYSIYFYIFINGWEGVLFFIFSMAGICFLFSLASGFISYFVAKHFVSRLYERLKHE